MDNEIDPAPSDDELADLYPNTLHTRWGREGFMGGIGAKGDDFVCTCEMCVKLRRDRWEKEPH